MRLILDTHILLWSLASSRALPPAATGLLLDPANEKIASAVSLWEVAIKFPLGRSAPDDLPFGAQQMAGLIGEAGLALLPVTTRHILAVERLPRGRHGDPFDRLLVVQAILEEARLLTQDTALATYGHAVLLV